MVIAVSRSRGVAGVREELGPLDAYSLPAELRLEIKWELSRVGFYQMASDPHSPEPASDGFGYTITVADGDRSHCVSFEEGEERGLARLLFLVERATDGWGATELI